MDFKSLLKVLVEKPKEFTPAQASQATLLLPTATPSQIACYLTGLKLSKLDSHPDIIASTAQALLSVSVTVSATDIPGVIGDIVGTGGDGQSTFNVSTAAALIASACGLKVAKVFPCPTLYYA
jgi:anthranilate phosphoribosyltransferase